MVTAFCEETKKFFVRIVNVILVNNLIGKLFVIQKRNFPKPFDIFSLEILKSLLNYASTSS